MKTIIRIEAPNGIGMFTNHKYPNVGDYLPELADRHLLFNTPFSEGLFINKNGLEWFCAYKSIEQLQKWVKANEFKKLFKVKYKVFLIDVSDWQEGRDQIMFAKEHIINKKDISSLFA